MTGMPRSTGSSNPGATNAQRTRFFYLAFLGSIFMLLQCQNQIHRTYFDEIKRSMVASSASDRVMQIEHLPVLPVDPGLKWPQQVDTLRKSIQEGTRINVDIEEYVDSSSNVRYYDCPLHNSNTTGKCEAPTKGLATIVTSYYHLRAKHSWAEYRNWMNLMLAATDPMVIFVHPGGIPQGQQEDWHQFVADRRKHAPTIVAQIPFKNLTMPTTFAQDFWENEVVPTETRAGFMEKLGPDVYKVWNEKIIMMQEVARLNPFNSEHLFWIDIGYYRNTRAFVPNYVPIVRNNITANGVRRDQILFQNMFHEPENYLIAGGAWGGTVRAIHNAYEKYWQTFWWMVVSRYKSCVGYEQNVMATMCKSFQGLCNIHMSTIDSPQTVSRRREWNAMGKKWLPNPTHDWRRPFPYLHNETGIVKEIPFPSERVIHTVDRSSAIDEMRQS